MRRNDLTIIGAGPAGLTAGIYAGRAGLQTIIIEAGVIGGMPTTTHKIENYPGFPDAPSGSQIMERIQAQAKQFGTEIVNGQVRSINQGDDDFIVATDSDEYSSKYVLIASGTGYIKPNIPGIEKFTGRGVSYCATCDGPFYKDTEIAVIGCGNSGLQEGQFLMQLAQKVHFIEFLPQMTAEKIHQQRVQNNPKAVVYLNTELTAVNGDQVVNSITIKDRASGEKQNIPVEGVFVFTGMKPNTVFVPEKLTTDEKGYIITDDALETSMSNIFAAGDVREKDVRQITTAVADGTVAVVKINERMLITK